MSWNYVITNKLNVLTLEQKQANVLEIYSQLKTNGWTIEAICGLLGNVSVESGFNPAQTQQGYKVGSEKGGYGLVQWTPASKYQNWCKAENHSLTSGYWQVYNIDNESSGKQYYQTSAFPFSYADYKISTQPPAYLAEAFLKNYERAGVEALQRRKDEANYWYEFLTGKTPVPPTPDPTPYQKIGSNMPVWMMVKFR